MIKAFLIKKKDKIGKITIPSESSFFAVVLKDTMNVLTSRQNKLQRTVDILNIEFIKPIPEINRLKGGVKDFGSFNEGFCFQVITVVPYEFYQINSSSASEKHKRNAY